MSNYHIYFALEKKLKATGMEVDRSELIHAFTQDKKTSLRALTDDEYRDFIRTLKQSLSQQNTDWQNSPENKMRRKVYYLFVRQMQYTKEEMNAWCVHYGQFHKPLYYHDYNELVKLLTQAEKVYKSYVMGL